MTGRAVATKKQTVTDLLVASKERIAEVLPDGVGADRFLRIARLQIAQQPELLQCDPVSVLTSITNIARLGLSIGREAHIVKYGNKAQVIIDYRGYQRLARESGLVSHIEAASVYVDDDFAFEDGDAGFLRHRPKLNTGKRTKEHMVCAYAIAYFTTGAKPTHLVLDMDDIERLRKRSKAKDAGPWKTDFARMSEKSAIRHICDKRLPSSDERLNAALEMDSRADGYGSNPLPWEQVEQVTKRITESVEEKLEELAPTADQPDD